METPLPKNFSMPKVTLSPALKKSGHSLMEVVLLLVVIGLGYWYLVSPKAAGLEAQRVKRDALVKERDKISGDLDTLRSLVSKLNAHKADVEKLDDALPLNSKPFSLEVLINQLAQESGVVIGSVSVSGKGDSIVAGNRDALQNPFAASRSLQKVAANTSVSGSFSQLETFLKKLENSARIINVNSLEISSAKSDSIDLRAGLEAYYYASN
ncbi:MAG: type 4a pilus biogenesis protein PilO [Patescibacteria group bacterium]|nr:type 4a pilus biogenesis protein PilO [Patescibacteria group bacterium]